MANYFLTETAQFRPFSYQEMLAPVKAYQDAYNEADEKLNLLLEDAALKAFNFAPQDAAEKAVYNTMMSKLKDASDKLSSGDPTAFKTIREVNKDYRKTMIPIQQQIIKRAELAKEQRDKQSANPNLRFTTDFSKANLKDITSASSYETINLDDIEKSIGTEFAGQVQTYFRNDLPLERVGNTDHYTYTTGVGYTQQEFRDAFIGGPNGGPQTDSFIYKYYKQKADVIDARTDISDTVKNEMKERVLEGMKANAGTFKSQIINDPYYIHSKDKSGSTDKVIESQLKNTPVFIGAFDEDESGWPTKANYMINGTMHVAENIKWVDITEKEISGYKKAGYPIYPYTNAEGKTKYKTINPAGFVKVGTQGQEKQDYETSTWEYGYDPKTGKTGWHEVKRESRTYGGVQVPLRPDEEEEGANNQKPANNFGRGKKQR